MDFLLLPYRAEQPLIEKHNIETLMKKIMLSHDSSLRANSPFFDRPRFCLTLIAVYKKLRYRSLVS